MAQPQLLNWHTEEFRDKVISKIQFALDADTLKFPRGTEDRTAADLEAITYALCENSKEDYQLALARFMMAKHRPRRPVPIATEPAWANNANENSKNCFDGQIVNDPIRTSGENQQGTSDSDNDKHTDTNGVNQQAEQVDETPLSLPPAKIVRESPAAAHSKEGENNVMSGAEPRMSAAFSKMLSRLSEESRREILIFPKDDQERILQHLTSCVPTCAPPPVSAAAVFPSDSPAELLRRATSDSISQRDTETDRQTDEAAALTSSDTRGSKMTRALSVFDIGVVIGSEPIKKLTKSDKTAACGDRETVKSPQKEALANRIRKSLECPICLHLFINPKTLRCGHSLCEGCCRSIQKRRPMKLDCPICRQSTRANAVDLPTDYSLVSLVEIVREEEPDS